MHDPDDGIFWGTCSVPLRNGMNTQALRIAQGEAAEVRDLSKHEKYRSHTHALNPPYIRSWAGVPLRSPTGFPVGTVSIFDDKPRPDGLSSGEVMFMNDVAVSIVSHLELSRTKAVYERGIKMVKGLSQFMEGRIPRDGRKRSRGLSKDSKRKRSEPVQLSLSETLMPLRSQDTAELSDQSHMEDVRRTSVHNFTEPDQVSLPIEAAADEVQIDELHIDSAKSEQTSDHADEILTTTDSIPEQAHEEIVSKDIGKAFRRGARIILDAMDMAGVLFLHASPSALGDLRAPTAQTPDQSDAGASTTPGSDDTLSVDEGALGSRKRKPSAAKMCRPLATAFRSSNSDAARLGNVGVSERFLKSLMQRFPYGRIWNFSGDELLPSDEHSDSTLTHKRVNSIPNAEGGHMSKRRRLRSDHERILDLFPGVRSFGIMPMWDTHSKRFFSGAIVWSYNTSRIFSMTDEINYLGAFCDVVMAEVGRLDVQADVQSKTTFISSISHELRSPLHGILGGVEYLQETLESSSGDQMLQMIDTCGRSLLDIINNLLDHAQASSHESNGRFVSKRRKQRASRHLATLEPAHDLAILTEEVLDSALWLTPEPAPRSTPSIANLEDDTSGSEPLKVALEVDSENVPASGWNFHIDAGAWRRILQNLTTNAIKYTDRGGYFKVRLAMRPISEAQSSMRTIELTCSDSGRGMSKEYLNCGLWREFQQEENNVQGTGLGLSLVKNLVEDMGGVIRIDSSKGVGTTVNMTVSFIPGLSIAERQIMLSDAQRPHGLSYDIVGFDTVEADNSRQAASDTVMRSSIAQACERLGLRQSQPGNSSLSGPDIYIISEREATTTMKDMKNRTSAWHRFRGKPRIILCASASSSRAFITAGVGWLTSAAIVSQPLGPRKLFQALTLCVDKANSAKSEDVLDQRSLGQQANGIADLPQQQELAALSITTNGLHGMPAKAPVLLVDDNPVNLAILQKSLQKMGRAQISASNGLEAIEAYRKSFARSLPDDVDNTDVMNGVTHHPPPISIIFMDITMPVMDGLECTRRIRAYERTHRLRPARIAALTALASDDAKREAFDSGIDLFLTKPIRLKEIQSQLEEWDQDPGM